MDCFNRPTIIRFQFSSEISPLKPNNLFPHYFRRNPSRNGGIYPSFLIKIPFSTPSSPFSNGRKFQISAHFGRASKRRNSLRKKLIEEQKVRRDTDTIDTGSNSHYPISTSDENEQFESKQSLGNLEESGSTSVSVEKSKLLQDSVLWSKFESWVDQYKKDAEFWGIGSGPVFTVFQERDGNVERVSINEDEILRRSRIEPSFFKQEGHKGNFVEASSKISYAKRLAREIERGEYKLQSNSSIAKFVVSGQESGFVNRLRSGLILPQVLPKLPRIGFGMICSYFIFWLVKETLMGNKNGVELTREEKKMLQRKMKSRMEKEKLETGSVEVLPKVANSLVGSTTRPLLDKQELMSSISKAKTSGKELKLPHSSSSLDIETKNFNDKIQEIKDMARKARELEQKNRDQHDGVNADFAELENLEIHKEMSVHHVHNLSSGDPLKPMGINENKEPQFVDDPPTAGIEGSGNETKTQWDLNSEQSSTLRAMGTKEESLTCDNPITVPLTFDDPSTVDIPPLLDGSSVCSSSSQSSASPLKSEGLDNEMNNQWDLNRRESRSSHLQHAGEKVESYDALANETCDSNKSSINTKPKIILTVKEAREYLSQKHDRGELDREPKDRSLSSGVDVSETDMEEHVRESKMMHNEKALYESSLLDKTSKTLSVKNACGDLSQKQTNTDGDDLQRSQLKTDDSSAIDKNDEIGNFQRPITSEEYGGNDRNHEATPAIPKESWLEKNFQDFEPIAKKIGDGFRENFMIAKEKVQEELNLRPEITLLGNNEDDSELEWMKDDSLREIVFQVRENELMGRDPFHMMDAEDKQAFFKGLEKKVEKESEKLLNVHEWIHSKIENLDYGADGISLYDPPEKVIPRWKGPTVDKNPAFLNNAGNHQRVVFDEKTGLSHPVNQNLQDTLKKSADTAANDDDDALSSLSIHNSMKTPQSRDYKNPKIVIESSDGSIRAGKKSGKEYWQHTKKWSREFLELYNTETDPEVKSIMKDMGKDLNRWITEKEIQETADLMTKIPKRKRRYIEKKLEKLKREMEMFGPQAVVSKYREYAEEEEDYLWWLDLPFVLCIELYTDEDGAQKVGLYSLEMAEDLKLDPKQYHVIAFEDPGDSKSFCYIIQAHMEMLGRGSAFVVARPPKDAFREAKANGFSVTVIRKGELQLNVDQTLEEVEEQIAEIGSKLYHDKIMHDRSVDMGSLMKGVFGSSKTAKRGRSKQRLKKVPASEP